MSQHFKVDSLQEFSSCFNTLSRTIEKYVVYYSYKGSPEDWSLLDSYQYEQRDAYFNNVSHNTSLPISTFPVVKDGVFMVSVADKVDHSLTFFKVDYFEELMSVTNRDVVTACAVMRDSIKGSKIESEDKRKMFDAGIILKNIKNHSHQKSFLND